MQILLNEDDSLVISVSPEDNSLRIEIPRGRDTINAVYIHDSRVVEISREWDGIRVRC